MSSSSSDDEQELVPQSVTNYYFEDGDAEPVSFSVLPLQPRGAEKPPAPKLQVFLHGVSDGGLQKVYRHVTAWSLGLRGNRPEISVLTKDGKWIKLLKPRKIYEEETARTVLLTVHLLHFLRRKPESSGKSLWSHLNKVFRFENPVSEDDVRDHHALIKQVIEKDRTLEKCQLLLMFVKKGDKKRISIEGDHNVPDAKKSFIAPDDDVSEGMENNDDDDSDKESYLFDSVCAICDNGGELLCCDGRCLRSFHATRNDGVDSHCKSLGFSRSQVEAIQNFLCKNCLYKKHQCFACGKLGSSDKCAGAEVLPCVNATCGKFYHPKCAAELLYRGNKAKASECEKKITAGESFTCPVHKCIACYKGENKEVEELQFAMCRRCPKSYHRKCLPREIAFDYIEEEGIVQRAWDYLLPNRILIYCRDHEIIGAIATPIRNHIIFPEILEKNTDVDAHKSKFDALVKRENQDLDVLPRDQSSVKPKVVKGKLSSLERGHFLAKSSRKNNSELTEPKKLKLLKHRTQPDLRKVSVDNNALTKEKTKALLTTAPSISTGKKSSSCFPIIDTETEKRIALLMEETSSITLDDVIKKRMVLSTYAYSARQIDKNITQCKVEGAIEALRTALKKLEDGGSVEDARAVCEPEMLKQIVRWSNKLKVYLAPFLHGGRYTSFGRHFTKVDKLMEIVEKLQWYVQHGDMIVDFCCGANDFSQLMKEKLEAAGKKCLFKNYDVIQPKNDFCFEKRDWMKVQPKELPTGSQLIMGLNPPFGVKATLANKFIDKALTFKPKLIILIVPPETERLDKKNAQYDLVWEDFQNLSGKSFYLPGSVDVNDNQMEQWNNTPPVLYMWSRPDWTAKYKAIALNQQHIDNELKVDTVPVNETNGKVHKKIDAAPGESEVRTEGIKITEHNKINMENNSENSSKRRKMERNEHGSNGEKLVETSDKSKSNVDDTKNSRETLKDHVTSVAFETHAEGNNTLLESTNYHAAYPMAEFEFSAVTGCGRSATVFIDDIAERCTPPSNMEELQNNNSNNWSGGGISGSDYSIKNLEPQFPSYIRDHNIDSFSRKPYLNGFDDYRKTSEEEMHLQPKVSDVQGQDDLAQSRFSMSGSECTLAHTSRYSSSSLGLMSSAAGSSTMQRYAPHLDETNDPRMGASTPGGVPPGSSIYGIPGTQYVPSDSIMGFATGPHHVYPRQGSCGWLDD